MYQPNDAIGFIVDMEECLYTNDAARARERLERFHCSTMKSAMFGHFLKNACSPELAEEFLRDNQHALFDAPDAPEPEQGCTPCDCCRGNRVQDPLCPHEACGDECAASQLPSPLDEVMDWPVLDMIEGMINSSNLSFQFEPLIELFESHRIRIPHNLHFQIQQRLTDALDIDRVKAIMSLLRCIGVGQSTPRRPCSQLRKKDNALTGILAILPDDMPTFFQQLRHLIGLFTVGELSLERAMWQLQDIMAQKDKYCRDPTEKALSGAWMHVLLQADTQANQTLRAWVHLLAVLCGHFGLTMFAQGRKRNIDISVLCREPTPKRVTELLLFHPITVATIYGHAELLEERIQDNERSIRAKRRLIKAAAPYISKNKLRGALQVLKNCYEY